MDIFLLISLISLFLIFYTAVIYPVLLSIFSKFSSNEIKKHNETFLPTVNVVISAFNEEKYISDCIQSVLQSDYPHNKLKVFAGSDGSSDDTFRIISELSDNYENLNVFNFERSGKNKVLNELCENVDSELVFFMDADVRLDEDTLKRAVSHFADESIGAVICGMNSLDLKNGRNVGQEGESLYQKYENSLRINETKLGTTVASLGAFYGIRSKNYKPLPDDSVLDDLMPLINTAIAGEKVIYLDNVSVAEVRPKSGADEFSRKIRISAAGFTTLWFFRHSLDKLFNKYGFFMLSHKLIRWSMPHLLLVMIVSSIYISDNYSRNIFLLGEILLFLLAIIGYFFEKLNIRIKIIRIFMLFMSINISFLLGYIRFITGDKISVWSRNK